MSVSGNDLQSRGNAQSSEGASKGSSEGASRMARYFVERERMRAAGGDARVAAQKSKGKLTARERILELCDADSFIEQQPYIQSRAIEFGLDKQRHYGDGVVTGCAQINGQQVFLSAQDFTILGGSLGEMHAQRIAIAQEEALLTGTPFIQINDSGGARIQEGIRSLQGYGRIFRNNTRSSGVIPQIAIIVGPCAGGAVYSPAIMDFIFVVDTISQMYITGPDVIKTVTGEQISHQDLGGAGTHSSLSGVAHFRAASEQDCFEQLRRLLSFLPPNNRQSPPSVPSGDAPNRETPELEDIIPDAANQGYDVRKVVAAICDKGEFFEISADYAPNIVIGFGRVDGNTVGFFANQPSVLAGALDINSSDKAARFVRFCDSFNIPLVSLVDVPGFLPGIAQEHGGIIRHGAKMLYAIAEATVPKISLILRKAYGGAYISMAAKSLGYDRVLAYPFAEIAVMGSEGAVSIIFRKQIADAADGPREREKKIAEFKEQVMNPYIAAGYGFIDAVIEPRFTRREILRSLAMYRNKKEQQPYRKHGNIPL